MIGNENDFGVDRYDPVGEISWWRWLEGGSLDIGYVVWPLKWMVVDGDNTCRNRSNWIIPVESYSYCCNSTPEAPTEEGVSGWFTMFVVRDAPLHYRTHWQYHRWGWQVWHWYGSVRNITRGSEHCVCMLPDASKVIPNRRSMSRYLRWRKPVNHESAREHSGRRNWLTRD